MGNGYKTIQVTPKEYELLLQLQEHLIERGTRSIEEKFGREIEVDKILQKLERKTLAKGAVAGLAIAIVLHVLKEEKR